MTTSHPAHAYFYRLDNDKDRPDPASVNCPKGCMALANSLTPHLNGAMEVRAGLPLPRYIIYELHVGTFTAEGTLGTIIPYLPWLKELGITAIELMPVARSGKPQLGL
ncbi:MAG: hypothetical protein V9E94_04150 [Microthrixaceae bacterium]